MPLVSVLVPVYNMKRYLPECLESLVNQTLEDIEIVCINDGSTDDSLDILRKYARRDHRIKIIDKGNTGYGHTMNVGVQVAKGDYIGILESDDFADGKMFETLYRVASHFDADLVKSNYWEYRDNESRFVRLLEDGPYGKVLKPRHDLVRAFIFKPTIWSAIYKREFLLKNAISFNETPGASFQDTSFNFKVLACAERAVLVETAYVHYRQDNETSSVNGSDKVYCVVDEYKKCAAFLETRPELKEQLEYLLPALKWNTYQWNYRRISFSVKYEFLEKMVYYFHELWDSGSIRPSYWYYKVHLDDLMRIMLDRDTFLHEVYCRFQKKVLFEAGLKYEFQHNRKMYLYGAGKIGCEIASYLRKCEMDFDGFIVADKENNPQAVLGKPVLSIDEVSDGGLDGVLVLLTVKESTQHEVLPVLRRRGFKNIVVVHNEMCEYLMQFDGYSIHQLVQHVFEK